MWVGEGGELNEDRRKVPPTMSTCQDGSDCEDLAIGVLGGQNHHAPII